MFLTLLTIFGSSFILALSGALMPGPVLTVTVSESVRRGAAVGPLMILGHGILELLLVIALLAGLAPLFNTTQMFVAISLSGGVILLWMSCSMFGNLSSMTLNVTTGSGRQRNLILAGMLLSAANPYWTIWWATIGMGYIVYSITFGLAGIVAFFSGHILADLTWYTIISCGVAKGRHLFSDRVYRKLIAFCACFLLLFSFYFFYSGIERII